MAHESDRSFYCACSENPLVSEHFVDNESFCNKKPQLTSRRSFYKSAVEPLLHNRDSELWHSRARHALSLAERSSLTLKLLELFAHKHRRFADPRLNVILGGQEIGGSTASEVFLDNPVMVGAGWDKAGEAVRALYQIGFSGVEVGSVLRYPQPGNDKPRQFMIGPGVCLNRLGFNSPGMDVVAVNLDKYLGGGIPMGISLGKNKDVSALGAPEAHAVVAAKMYEYASYFVINVSSPNTVGLRDLQQKGPLTDIIQAVNAVMDSRGGRKPLYVKIAPELSTAELDDVIDVVLAEGLTGIIAINTSNNPHLKAKYGEHWRTEMGGISGDDAEYRKMSIEKIAHIYRETQGKMEIIGVGGAKDADTVWEKITAGAKAVQIVTAIRSEGPAVAGHINRGLIKKMNQEGIANISEAVGMSL